LNKFRQLGKNIFLVFIGNIASKIVSFLMLPFYTKWLSVEEYGISDNAMVYVGLLIGIFTLSITESIFIFPKDKSLKIQKQFFSSGLIYSVISLLIAGFILFGINEILIYYNIMRSISNNIGFIYLLVISLFLQTFLQQFSRGINRIKVYAISGLILTLFTALLSIILMPIYGLNGFFIAQFSSYFITAIYTFFFSRSYKYFSLRHVDIDKFKEMTRYSIPLIPNLLTWWLIGYLNRPIMEEYLSMNAIGLFAIAYKIPSLINVLFSVFMVSWQISVIEEYKKENYEHFYNYILKLVFTLLSFFVILLSILGRALIYIIADSKFHEASLYIPLLALSTLFSSISGFVATNFSATRESKYYFYSSVWGAVVAIFLNLLLIPIWGLYGAVVAILFSHFIMLTSRIKYSWKIVKITNLYFYVLMLGITLGVVLFCSFIKDVFMLYSLIALVIVLFMFLIKKDMKHVFRLYTSMIYNKKIQ
jgi:O-antigen/teichoic acid export membrane protein